MRHLYALIIETFSLTGNSILVQNSNVRLFVGYMSFSRSAASFRENRFGISFTEKWLENHSLVPTDGLTKFSSDVTMLTCETQKLFIKITRPFQRRLTSNQTLLKIASFVHSTPVWTFIIKRSYGQLHKSDWNQSAIRIFFFIIDSFRRIKF